MSGVIGTILPAKKTPKTTKNRDLNILLSQAGMTYAK
jgi:hypothetical protein